MPENPNINEPNTPFLEKAAIKGAEIRSEKTGKPMVQILNEAAKKAESERRSSLSKFYRKIIDRLTGN